MVIVVGGMIGLGKTTVARILGKHFNSQVFYESVKDNPILPLFYSSTPEEIERHRYPFLLQIYFLNTRFRSIKKALVEDNNILDRSIYEDLYFCKKNMELGRISELEFTLYKDTLKNMMEELDELPKKSPDLMVYLKGGFNTVIDRINKRGRSYEIDNSLIDYYRYIWEGYDNWVMNHYRASDVVIIDMDKLDVLYNKEDENHMIQLVEGKLKDIRK